MIDCENEKVIPLREVPNHVPSRCMGKRLSPATVWRWANRQNNPLDTIQIGGGRFTSIEAIGRFVERCHSSERIVMPDDAARAEQAGRALRKLIGGSDGPRA